VARGNSDSRTSSRRLAERGDGLGLPSQPRLDHPRSSRSRGDSFRTRDQQRKRGSRGSAERKMEKRKRAGGWSKAQQSNTPWRTWTITEARKAEHLRAPRRIKRGGAIRINSPAKGTLDLAVGGTTKGSSYRPRPQTSTGRPLRPHRPGWSSARNHDPACLFPLVASLASGGCPRGHGHPDHEGTPVRPSGGATPSESPPGGGREESSARSLSRIRESKCAKGFAIGKGARKDEF